MNLDKEDMQDLLLLLESSLHVALSPEMSDENSKVLLQVIARFNVKIADMI
jgi:hypothetical protein